MARDRNPERGSVVVVSMLILVALVSLGGLTTLNVKSGIATSGHDRFRAVALYAAESGAAVGMDYLRRKIDADTSWSALVEAGDEPFVPLDLPGNGAQPGAAGNPFGADTKAWYEVAILNNFDDSGFSTGDDTDARVILRVTGHGPNGTVAQIEWDVNAGANGKYYRPCPNYAQGNIFSDGAGRNDCMGTISSDVATFSLNN